MQSLLGSLDPVLEPMPIPAHRFDEHHPGRSGKSGVNRSRNNQQHKERGNDDRRDEPALSHVAFRLAGDTRICRRRRDLGFWEIGHTPI